MRSVNISIANPKVVGPRKMLQQNADILSPIHLWNEAQILPDKIQMLST